jgi:hypothetical protein
VKGTTVISSKYFSVITQESILFAKRLQTDSDSLENQQNYSTGESGAGSCASPKIDAHR